MTSLQGKDALSKFLEVTSFGSEIWVKASWDLSLDLKPNWWKTRTDESGEVIAINYVFRLEGNALTQFKWGGRDKDGATIWQAYKVIQDGFNHLLILSDLGATIYFYPNKPSGGISNKHVRETNLLFYEIDHLSLDEQWQSVSRFTQSTGLHPSAIIFTGGKSLHVYFQLSEPIKKDDWLRLNRKLTIIQDGDPAICNAARAMRLPGMVRRKSVDEKPTSVSLEQWTESAYSPEEFEQALDSSGLFAYGLSDERWRQWRNAVLKARKGENINPTGILLSPEADLNPKLSYTIATTACVDPNIEFPLEITLTRNDRELIANGSPQGSRDDAGYRLAANIVATANHLNKLGYRFSGNPEQLFDEYCTRCSPPLTVRDKNRIWRQAERSATKAALDDSCLENCIRAWQYKNSVQNQPTSKDKLHKPGKTPSSKTDQALLLSPQSAIFAILNPPLTSSLPIQSLRDGIFKVLPIPESVASCLTTEEEKASRKERRWFESVLKRIKKVLLKSDKRPRLGFKCFEKDNPEFEEKIRQVQRKLRSLSYAADIETNQRYLPNDLVTQLPKSGLIGIKAPKGGGKSVLLKKIIALAKKQGIPVLSITPRIALGREQAIKWEITWIDDYGVLQTRAGDTTSQIQEVAEKRAKARVQLANLDSIKHQQLSLLGEGEIRAIEQQKADLRIEIERYGEEIENINSASVRTLALCWDSLWRTKDRDFKEALIIIDEAELGFQHFISGSTCKRNRPQLLQVFKTKLIECLMNGGRVILSDADLTDLPINYIREVLPIPIKPFIVTNNYIGDETRWIVDLRTGGSGDSRGNTLTDIIESIRDGKYLAITTDSQAEAQALERRILEEDFPDEFCPFLDSEGNITDEAQAKKNALIVRIDRTTTESEAGKKFIQKPNEQILHWQPRIIIYTPSMGVGVSIDESTQRWDSEWEEMVPYFDAVYGLFFGVIEPSQCRQQLARVRANVPRIVWCKEANKALEGCSSFFPDDVKRQTLKYNRVSLNILDIAKGIAGCDADDEEIREAMLQLLNEAWDSNSRCWKEPSIDLASAFKARENYGKWNLANLLREELQDEGHTVVSLKGTKTHEVSEIAEIKDDQKMQEATLIAEAPLMPIDEARKILSKLGVTKDVHRSAQKTLLQDELPEVDLTPEFVKKAVVDDRRRWLNQQRLFWYYTNAEALKQIDTDHWLGNLKKFTQGIPFMRDVRSHTPKVDALRKSGVFEFIDLEDCDRVYESDTTEAKKFLKQCLKHKDLLQTALNVLVTKKASPIGLANRILAKVGLELQKLTRSHKDTRWGLSADLVYDPDRTNVLRALELRWRMTLEEAQKNEAEKQAQTHTQQTTQVGGQSADYIYINQRISPPIDVVSQGCYQHSPPGGEPVGVGVYSEPQKSPQIQSQTVLQVGGQSADYIYKSEDIPPIDVVSQGAGESVCEATDCRTDLQRLIDAFQSCESFTDFVAVAEKFAVTREQVENVLLYQPARHRQLLRQWWEQGGADDTASAVPLPEKPSVPNPQFDVEEKRQLTLAKLLSEAWEHGVGTVKVFLSRLDRTDRWVAAMKFEEIDEARSRQLLEQNPDFYQWLGSMP